MIIRLSEKHFKTHTKSNYLDENVIYIWEKIQGYNRAYHSSLIFKVNIQKWKTFAWASKAEITLDLN